MTLSRAASMTLSSPEPSLEMDTSVWGEPDVSEVDAFSLAVQPARKAEKQRKWVALDMRGFTPKRVTRHGQANSAWHRARGFQPSAFRLQPSTFNLQASALVPRIQRDHTHIRLPPPRLSCSGLCVMTAQRRDAPCGNMQVERARCWLGWGSVPR